MPALGLLQVSQHPFWGWACGASPQGQAWKGEQQSGEALCRGCNRPPLGCLPGPPRSIASHLPGKHAEWTAVLSCMSWCLCLCWSPPGDWPGHRVGGIPGSRATGSPPPRSLKVWAPGLRGEASRSPIMIPAWAQCCPESLLDSWCQQFMPSGGSVRTLHLQSRGLPAGGDPPGASELSKPLRTSFRLPSWAKHSFGLCWLQQSRFFSSLGSRKNPGQVCGGG